MPSPQVIKRHEYHIELFAWIENQIGLPASFFNQLAQDNDWLFIIKWHAVLETCVNHLLLAHFKKPEAADAFARLEMSNFKSGKMAFVSACELLPKPMRTFIQRLSEMRNYAVHDVKHFDFTFNEYRDQVVKQDEKPAWRKAIAFAVKKEDGETCVAIADTVPRAAINLGCYFVVSEIFGYCAPREQIDSVVASISEVSTPDSAHLPEEPPKSEESTPKE